jgi:hypothetical protein
MFHLANILQALQMHHIAIAPSDNSTFAEASIHAEDVAKRASLVWSAILCITVVNIAMATQDVVSSCTLLSCVLHSHNTNKL